MKMPRFIPKRVFQIIALLLLAGPVLMIAGLIQLITGRSVFRK